MDTTLTDEDDGRMSVSRLIELLNDYPKDAKVKIDIPMEGIILDATEVTYDHYYKAVVITAD